MDIISAEVNNMLTKDTYATLIRHGFMLAPVHDGGIPVKHWQSRATTDADTTRAWFATETIGGITMPPCYDSALVRTGAPLPGGGYLLVLDVDMKNGKNGVLSLWALTLGDMPEGPSVRTPSGGLHYYFRSQKLYRQSIGTKTRGIGDGLDIKCAGGLVIAPGSAKAQGVYHWETSPDDAPLPDLPDWLEDWLDEHSAPDVLTSAAAAASAELYDDAPVDVAAAVQFLNARRPAVEGQGGDMWTVQTAMRLRDMGLSPAVAYQLMLTGHDDSDEAGDAWNDRCSPPWEPEALLAKIHSAYKSARNVAGCGSIAANIAAFKPEKVSDRQRPLPHEITNIFAAPSARNRRELAFVRFKDAKPTVGEMPLVDELLGLGEMSVIYGQSNSGKTFVALDMAHAVATGRPFFGRATEQGTVLYVAAEGGGGVNNRLAALQGQYGMDAMLTTITDSVDMHDPDADTSKIISRAKAEAAFFGTPLRLIVIDTLARAMSGGNENSPDDMGALIRNADFIRAATGAHLCFVHHSGKDEARGARGHSCLRAAVDTELEVAVGDDGKTRTLTTRKQRSIEFAPPIPFWLTPVKVGVRRDGAALTSCIVSKDAPNIRTMTAAEAARQDDDDDARFLSALDVRNSATPARAVSASSHAKTYAPKVMMLEAPWLGLPDADRRIASAMTRLLMAGKLNADGSVGIGKDRHKVRGVVRASP